MNSTDGQLYSVHNDFNRKTSKDVHFPFKLYNAYYSAGNI